jgi:hypothetical protein
MSRTAILLLVLGIPVWISQAAPQTSGPGTAATQQQDAVRAAYKLMEKAARTGDGELLLRLYDQKTLNMDAARIENLRRGFPARPSARYEPLVVRVKGDDAVIIGHVIDPKGGLLTHQFHSVMFHLEGGEWKIANEVWDQDPIDPVVAYALLPPDDGAFARTGSPWQKMSYANRNAKYYKADDPEMHWKLQAVQDESFLYVRIETESPFPAPGSEVSADAARRIDTAAPRGWPVMKITIAESGQRPARDFRFQVGSSIGDRATFDANGKANSHDHFISYALTVTKGENRTLFTNIAPDPASRLLAVHDRFIDVKIPLRTLGVSDASPLRIEIGDANWPSTKILPYQVSRFPN